MHATVSSRNQDRNFESLAEHKRNQTHLLGVDTVFCCYATVNVGPKLGSHRFFSAKYSEIPHAEIFSDRRRL